MSFSTLSRKLHRYGAIITAAPLLLVVGTGLILQMKKDFSWIQPPTRKGSASVPSIPFSGILDAARFVPEAKIESWADIDRLDVRPGQGVVKIHPKKSRIEIQVDLADGRVLQSAERRSDFIETLHDGAFFGDAVKRWVFLPSGVVLFGLWFTGLWLWVLPHWTKRRRAAKAGATRRS